MVCPKCHNKGFEADKETPRPLKNMGYKEHFKSFNLRRYVCLQCGYRFITKEEYYRDIKSQTNMFRDAG